MDSKAIYLIMVKKCPNTRRNKHYLKRYVRFIKACVESNINLPEEVYTEKHHILPKAKDFWPEYENISQNRWNLSILTGRQHVIAHWMLAKSLEGHMWSALWCFVSGFDHGYRNGKIESNLINSDFISKIRHEFSLVCSKRNKNYWTDEKRYAKSLKMIGSNNHYYGKSLPESSKILIGNANRGENSYWYGKKRPEHSENMKSIMKGREISQEHRENISKSHSVTYKCPHCGKEGGRLVLRWHYDNCYIVDESKNLYKAISPSGKEYLFGSVASFADDNKLSRSAIVYCLKNELGYYTIPKTCTNFSQNLFNTVDWRFIVMRKVKNIIK